jgi:hypothetical protein
MDARLTDHPLQPHHISLLAIFLLTFKDLQLKNFDPSFLLGLQRLLLDQVSEVTLALFISYRFLNVYRSHNQNIHGIFGTN